MVIDFHTHTFPDKIADSAIAKLKSAGHCKNYTGGTQNDLLSSMKEAKIDYSVVLPVATNPLKVSSINNLLIEEQTKGIINFGCMHPDFGDFDSELKKLAKNNIKGIKIHPIYQNVDIDSIKFLRILYKAAEYDLIVVTHSGFDIGFPGKDNCSPQKIRNVIHEIGNIKLVAAHLGGWKNWKSSFEYLCDTNVYLDTSFSLGKMESFDNYYNENECAFLGKEEFNEFIDLFGKERILFGTDSPWFDQKHNVDLIDRFVDDFYVKECICYKNAKKLLEL